jgi:hypothetical protein
MQRLLFTLAVVFFGILAGTIHAGSASPPLTTCDFARAYYIQDGGIVVKPYKHGFYYRHGVATPEGIIFRPGDTFVVYDSDRHVERVYWLLRVNLFNNRAYFHEQVYRYRVVTNSQGRTHRARRGLLVSKDFSLAHFRGLVAFDHSVYNIEMRPGSVLWQRNQFPSYGSMTGFRFQ